MPFPEDIFPNNQEVLNAFNLAEFTSRPLYITGKAGTGKSTFLRHYCQNTHKKYLILAPTGLAALNVGGQTIHSFFGLPPRPLQPNDKGISYFHQAKYDVNGNLEEDEHPKRKIIKKLDVIIIDEISMVRPDLIDAIDNSLRKNGGNANLPFGGKQIIFIGDLFQLEPVVTRDDLPIISRFYASPFFFSARVFQQMQFSNIELIRVYRQSDPNFIGLLDRIRNGKATNNDFISLNNKVNQNYEPAQNEYFIILCTTNAIADNLNASYLQNLPTPEFNYVGRIEGRFEDKLPTLQNLRLKVDSQVIFVKNDQGCRWVNGTIGKVTELKNETVKVKIKHEDIEIEYSVERVRWEKIEYKWINEAEEIESEIVGTFTQYPLKLAWAITIHKSQGLTFDQVIIDSGTGMFAHGQCYVALSRCTSFNGLIFKNFLRQSDIIIDNRVVQIANTANNQTTINEQLLAGLLDRTRVLNKQYAELINENRDLHNRLDEKNKKLLQLEQRTQEQSEEIEILGSSLEDAVQELEKTKKKLLSANKMNLKNSKLISGLQSKIQQGEKEINRQKNIKWYQKLVGTK
ncbi:helicase [Adhaeribacter arboris]|uniref:Helicase n=1 Tax=Adhaeribacter arboris TaxID=2072846 RepID=A0A2T2YNF3_9BACT|nr:AAA family ATPase [Adhaeribacter arboris]PSR57026.1 helicase [Adhaeribacter arboris]